MKTKEYLKGYEDCINHLVELYEKGIKQKTIDTYYLNIVATLINYSRERLVIMKCFQSIMDYVELQNKRNETKNASSEER